MGQNKNAPAPFLEEYSAAKKRKEPLKVKTKEIDEVDACRIIYVYGSLDANTGYILQEEIDKALAAGVINFIFDLEDLNYISSQSIGIFGNLKDTVKPYKGDVAMYGLRGKVLEMFSLLGFTSYFIVTNDIYEAIGELLTKDTTEEEEIVSRQDGSLLVEASMNLDDFMEAMGIMNYDDLKEEDFTTLSGLAMFLIGRVPKAGDLFSYQNLDFEVVDMDRGRVDKLLVVKHNEDEEGKEEK